MRMQLRPNANLQIRVVDEDVIVLRVAESGNKFFGAILPCVHKLDKQPMVLQTIFIGGLR